METRKVKLDIKEVESSGDTAREIGEDTSGRAKERQLMGESIFSNESTKTVNGNYIVTC